MKATIKNISRASQGVPCVDGLQFIEPGQTRTLDVVPEYVERLKALPFMMVDGEGENLEVEAKGGKETEAMVQMRVQHDRARADDIERLKASEKLVADQQSLLSERDAEIENLKQQMSKSTLVKLEAKHRGGGRYSVTDFRGKEVLGELDKADADAFNAMPAEEQAGYLAANKST